MSNWYVAADNRRRVRQIVVSCPSGDGRESEFGALGLAAKYQHLMSRPWTAGYFRTDANPGPYLLVRADGHIDEFRECPLRLAFAFYREPSAGLFGVFVSAEASPRLKQASPTGHAVVEGIFGLDVQDHVQRIRDALARPIVHICFADKSTSMSVEMIDDNGRVTSLTAPHCRFDRVVPVDDTCRGALAEHLDGLLAHHKKTRGDFQRASQELSIDFPAHEYPILPKATTSEAASGHVTQEAKPWWAFWR